MTPIVTTELEADACGLDGPELTAELLRENSHLIDENQRLAARGQRQFALMVAAIVIASAAIAWGAYRTSDWSAERCKPSEQEQQP